MRKGIIYIFALLLGVLLSCTTEEVVYRQLNIYPELASFGGIVRERMYYSGDDSCPYVAVPYLNDSEQIIEVEINNSYPSSSSIMVSNSAQTLEKGEGELKVPIYGSLDDANASFSLDFDIIAYGSYSWNVCLDDIEVYAKDYLLPDIELEIISQPSIVRGVSLKQAQIELSYNNGFAREGDFSFEIQDAVGLSIASLSEVELVNNAQKTTLSFDIEGEYNGDLSLLNFTVKFTTTQTQVFSVVGELEVKDASELVFETLTSSVDLEQARSLDNEYLILSYKGGDNRLITLGAEFESGFGLSAISSKEYALESDEGKIYLYFNSESPLLSGQMKVDIQYSGEAVESNQSETFEIEVAEKTPDILISEIRLLGSIIEGGVQDDDFILEVDYSNGTQGKELFVEALSQCFDYDSEALAEVSSFLIKEQSATARFNLGSDVILNSKNISSSTGLSEQNIVLVNLNYNKSSLDEQQSEQINFSGLIFNKLPYYTITLANGQLWLDRNLGASSIEPSDEYASSVGCEYNWKAYGDFYQRGRSTGLKLKVDSNNPYAANSLQSYTKPYLDPTSGDWEDGYWTNPSTDDLAVPTYSSGYETTLDNMWNSENGGENNPCPEGYRLPTLSQVQSMFITVSGVDYSQSTVSSLNKLITKMNFAYSGYIHHIGLVNSTLYYSSSADAFYNSHNYRGSQGGVGMIVNGNNDVILPYWKGEGGFTLGDLSNPESVGEIAILTCDYLTTTASTYVQTVVGKASGEIANQTMRYERAMPVRCLLNK